MTDNDKAIAAYDRDAAALAERYESVGTGLGFRRLIAPAEPGAIALDIGAGTGRDAEFLVRLGYEVVAAEPAAGMRTEGMRRHPLDTIRWLDDRLPTLREVHRLGIQFDLILLSAVWQHIVPADRGRAFRKIVTLMKPGGQLVMTLREGPAPEDRPMFPVSLGELEQLARTFGLEVTRVVEAEDELGRGAVAWTSVALRMPDDGSGALPLIRGIILSDEKASTYKLALLRSLSRIAEYAPALAEPSLEEDVVEVPLGAVALFWIRMYLPLVRGGLPQMPNNSGPDGLGFAKAGFRALLEQNFTAAELRPGTSFGHDTGQAVSAAIREAAATISNMPANFIRFPNSGSRVFETARETNRCFGAMALDPETLRSWGSLRVPGLVWRAMVRLGTWIEPVLISEWARMIRGYADRMGMRLAPGSVEGALAWIEPARETTIGRAAVRKAQLDGRVICVWSGALLDETNLDIDHCLPWAAWPCSDLWNLMPSHRRVNQHQKRDRLPSAKMLSTSRERILDWWDRAWLSNPALELRFFREAAAALPIAEVQDVEQVFSGMDWRRFRLRQEQQVPEWHLN